ncbi:hypothetical protein HK096_006963 [Nowakowskiella sp. JEL0078]|nr:hypothetical protein HK096_006963 [Nowakowskiella sp. JEL0078]
MNQFSHENAKTKHGIQVSRRSPSISHGHQDDIPTANNRFSKLSHEIILEAKEESSESESSEEFTIKVMRKAVSHEYIDSRRQRGTNAKQQRSASFSHKTTGMPISNHPYKIANSNFNNQTGNQLYYIPAKNNISASHSYQSRPNSFNEFSYMPGLENRSRRMSLQEISVSQENREQRFLKQFAFVDPYWIQRPNNNISQNYRRSTQSLNEAPIITFRNSDYEQSDAWNFHAAAWQNYYIHNQGLLPNMLSNGAAILDNRARSRAQNNEFKKKIHMSDDDNEPLWIKRQQFINQNGSGKSGYNTLSSLKVPTQNYRGANPKRSSKKIIFSSTNIENLDGHLKDSFDPPVSSKTSTVASSFGSSVTSILTLPQIDTIETIPVISEKPKTKTKSAGWKFWCKKFWFRKV